MRDYKLEDGQGGSPAKAGVHPAPSGLSTIAYWTENHENTPGRALAEHAKLNGDQPVKLVEHFLNDSRTKKHAKEGLGPIGGKRDVIKEFTDASLGRLHFTARNCGVKFMSMMTLTYPGEFPTDGRAVKRHLKAFVQRLKRRHPDVLAIWWMEFQRRGAPHFHLILNIDLASLADLQGFELVFRKRKKSYGREGYWTHDLEEAWLSQVWYRIVDSGDPAHLKAGCSWEMIESERGALHYVAAHASKRKQKAVPKEFQNVGRVWGTIGKLKAVKVGETHITTAEVFDTLGPDALSSRGRQKKYLYDASGRFSYDDAL